MLQPKRNTVKAKILPKREEDLEQSMENYKLLRASALRGSGVKSDYKADLRSPEETRPAYDELRASAKRGYKVNTGYKPDLRKPEKAMVEYKRVRGEEVAEYKLGGAISTDVVKAANGAEILGAIAPLASAIPVVGEFAAPILSGVSALWGANQAKKMQRRAQLQAQKTNYDVAQREQNIYAKQFAEDNKSSLPVYAKGGNMKPTYSTVKKYALGDSIETEQDITPITSNKPSPKGELEAVGGDLIPISDNAEVVSGNTHKENKIDGSYGVTLSNGDQPVANVEDKEVIVDNDLVFSDKLKKGNQTFADIALKVNTKIGDLQNKLKDVKSNAEKFSIERTIQGLEKANQDLFNEQQVVKNNTIGEEQEMVNVEDGIVPKGANGLNIPGKPTKPAWMKDMNKLVYGDPVTAVSTIKPITTKSILPNVGKLPDITNTSKSYEKDLEGIGSATSSTLSRLAPMLTDNIANVIITSKAPLPPKPLVRRAPILDTNVNIQPQLSQIAKAVGSSKAGILGNTSSSAVARAAMTAANLRGAELAGDVYAKKDNTERDLKNRQAEILSKTADVNAQLQDDYQSDVREHILEKQAGFSKNIVNAVEDYQAVKQAELMDKQAKDIIDLNLMDDPTGEKLRTYRRLGQTMSKPSKIQLLKEIQRKKSL